MKKYFLFTLIFGITFFISQETISQVAETVNNKSELFNDSGYVKGITTARAVGLVELALGIASIVIGLGARKRAKTGIGNKGQKGAKVALLLGSTAIVLSIIHLSITAGAVFGSGSGKAGAILAFILSAIGIIFSALVLRQKKI